MNVSVIALYKCFPIDTSIFNGFLLNLKKQGDELNIITCNEFIDSRIPDFNIKKELKYSLSDDAKKLSRKAVVKTFDEVYRKINDNGFYTALVIPISNWRILYNLKYSYLQLSNKHILFYLDSIEEADMEQFHKLVQYIDRFRNIHVGIAKSEEEILCFKKLINLHLLLSENLGDRKSVV